MPRSHSSTVSITIGKLLLEEIKRLMVSAQEEADSIREALELKFGDAKAAV
jgi:hypothetical protein